MKKKLGIIFLCVVILLTGCASSDASSVYDNDRKIASQSNTYNKVNYEMSENNGTITLSCEVFEGMDTIWSYTASEDMKVNIRYSLKVDNGKAKLVQILPDGALETIVEVTDETEEADKVEKTLQLKKGKNRIKIIGGEDTAVKLELTIAFSSEKSTDGF